MKNILDLIRDYSGLEPNDRIIIRQSETHSIRLIFLQTVDGFDIDLERWDDEKNDYDLGVTIDECGGLYIERWIINSPESTGLNLGTDGKNKFGTWIS